MIHLPFWAECCCIFLALVALDMSWARYTFAVTNNSPVRAGGWAGAIYLMGGTATLGYTHNPWLLVPAIAGAFVGTSVAVWWEARA